MDDAKRRPAAVVVGILDQPPHGVIFIERAAHLRSHAGQIGLPGGGMDEIDGGDLAKTALREMEEEVGVDPRRVRIVGKLPIVRARVNNYAVSPYVAVVRAGELRIDASETVGVFTVPLTTIVEELREGIVMIGDHELKTPILDYGNRRIWGLTGHILRSFVASWNTPERTLQAAVEAALAHR
ncbi:MAG: CoA pyrophosphatase [Candidatus Eremiobacteraeota bacterium]|nr:CoA pyrophosphatase [Candidatus Eremiobacteraeota bacterium]